MTTMAEPSPTGVRSKLPTDDPSNWSHRRQELSVVAWVSFLTASVATMVFFAVFDPLLLADDDNPPFWLANRMTGYALGFFFFWIVSFGAAFITAHLLDTPPPKKEIV